MAESSVVMTIGAVCFGLTTGYITYRTLVRSTNATTISDLGAVIAAVGGAAVTGLFDPHDSNLFGWYSIGLLIGMILYFVAFLAMNGKQKAAAVLSGQTIHSPTGQGPHRPLA